MSGPALPLAASAAARPGFASCDRSVGIVSGGTVVIEIVALRGDGARSENGAVTATIGGDDRSERLQGALVAHAAARRGGIARDGRVRQLQGALKIAATSDSSYTPPPVPSAPVPVAVLPTSVLFVIVVVVGSIPPMLLFIATPPPTPFVAELPEIVLPVTVRKALLSMPPPTPPLPPLAVFPDIVLLTTFIAAIEIGDPTATPMVARARVVAGIAGDCAIVIVVRLVFVPS